MLARNFTGAPCLAAFCSSLYLSSSLVMASSIGDRDRQKKGISEFSFYGRMEGQSSVFLVGVYHISILLVVR